MIRSILKFLIFLFFILPMILIFLKWFAGFLQLNFLGR